MDGHTTQIHVTIPKNFLRLIDKAASDLGVSRSSFIRIALMEKTHINSLVNLSLTPEAKAQKSQETIEEKELKKASDEMWDKIFGRNKDESHE